MPPRARPPRASRRNGPPARPRVVPVRAADRGAVGGFPDSIRTSLQYEVHARISPGVVTEYDTLFSLNGAFDPEITGVGHQPRCFDQYSLLYARYRVDKVHYRVVARQRAAHGVVMTLLPANRQTQFVAADRPLENTRAMVSSVTGSSQPAIDMSMTLLPCSIIGLTPQQYQNEEDCSAPVTQNPNQQAYMHVYFAQLDGATVLDVECSVMIRFDITFYDRIDPGVSTLEQLATLHRELRLLQEEEEVQERPVVVAPPPPRSSSASARSSRG